MLNSCFHRANMQSSASCDRHTTLRRLKGSRSARFTRGAYGTNLPGGAFEQRLVFNVRDCNARFTETPILEPAVKLLLAGLPYCKMQDVVQAIVYVSWNQASSPSAHAADIIVNALQGSDEQEGCGIGHRRRSSRGDATAPRSKRRRHSSGRLPDGLCEAGNLHDQASVAAFDCWSKTPILIALASGFYLARAPQSGGHCTRRRPPDRQGTRPGVGLRRVPRSRWRLLGVQEARLSDHHGRHPKNRHVIGVLDPTTRVRLSSEKKLFCPWQCRDCCLV